jgi:hypothetical protein
MSRAPARFSVVAVGALIALAVGAPSTFAADGVGLWGPTDDKVVTYWGFGVIIFFAVLVTVLSLIQIRLESRKERLRREIERLRPPAAD